MTGRTVSAPAREDAGGSLTEELSGLSAQQVDFRSATWRSRGGLLISYLVAVFVLVTANFFLPRLAPGDPIAALLSPGSPSYVPSEDLRAELARFYGLDQPLWEQYVDYLADLAHGNFGISIRYQVPVAELITVRLPWTVLLIVTAMALAMVVGWPAGAQSAWRRGRPVDRSLLGLFLTLKSFPAFFLASIVAFVFAVQLGWFPLSGATTAFAQAQSLPARVLDIAHHLVLPASVLAVGFAASQYLVMRAGMVGELGSGYLLLGRAKGLRERRLKYHYAARNALLPVVTLTAVHLGFAVSHSVYVETVFAYPGLGRLMFDAVAFRDYPTLQACFLVLTLVVLTATFLADRLYGWLDPRTST
ncbi:MAG: ABC transporter permease [Actinomycetota bacterium]|nr:ABC transporter permease [Actinomycetota bacterium]